MGITPWRSTTTALLLSAMAGCASAPVEASRRVDAGHDAGYYVYADVVEVSPRYGWHEVTEPVRECVELAPERHFGWQDRSYRRYYDDRRPGYRHEPRHHAGEGAAGLVGGLIGGLIGNQFGGGNGKTALTIAGAAIGASVARDHVRRSEHDYPGRSYRDHHGYEPYADARAVMSCTESERTRRVRGVNGYDVTYRYQGATFHKWVDEHPGDAIRVRVDVEPVASY